MSPDLSKIKSLLADYDSSKDPRHRADLLDELQDAVGMAGKMVMDGDILKKAKSLSGSGK